MTATAEREESLAVRLARAAWAAGGTSYDSRAEVTHEGVYEQRTLVSTSSGYEIGSASPALPMLPDSAGRVCDLFRRQSTDQGQVYYARFVAPAETDTSASAVAEGAVKPEGTMRFEGDVMPVGKVAEWIPATAELIEDVLGLIDRVERRLFADVAAKESDQLLNGDGVGENLLGLRNVSGVLTQTFSTSVTETVARALAKVEAKGGVVDAVALDPLALELARVAAPAYWADLATRVSIVPAPAAGTNKAIVGAFQTGAVIRERSTIARMASSHSDYFVKNKIAIVGEKRECLIVDAPYFFCDATLA